MMEVKNLSFRYRGAGKRILDRISFRAEKGSCLAVLGNNGAGKSTLLKCMSRICRAGEGSVLVDGEDILRISGKEMARKIAYVPQSSQASHTMVFDEVLLGRKPYIKWDITKEDQRLVMEILEQLELTGFASRYLDELSGGERQKVVLARALAQQPEFLLLDEPTSSLDPRNQQEMLRTVRSLTEEQGLGVVIVIHDLNLALRYCDRFLFIRDADVYACGGPETVTDASIRAVYGMEAEILEYGGKKLVVPL